MIDSFQGQYRWLSNFHLGTVEYEGLTYPSVEHAYQAAKVPANMRGFFRQGTCGYAKKLGQTVTVSTDWEDRKLSVMEALLKQKFAPHTELAQKLRDTGTHHLIEGNTWGDDFWGQCPLGNGENHLGKLLMKIRSELQKTKG